LPQQLPEFLPVGGAQLGPVRLGGVGFGPQTSQALSVKDMNGFPYALIAAMEFGSNLPGRLLLAACQQDLATAQREGVGRMQPFLQHFQFRFREGA